MELEEKLTLLGDQAADDFEESAKRSGNSEQDASSPCGIRPRKGTRMAGITEVSLPGGGSMRLMRVMMTNVCRFSCSYCAIRAGRRMPRASFQPEELANAFISAYQRGFCEGLFVTSAIPGPAPRQMDKMIALMEILRERYGYGGYIHVKILPGSEPAQIERAAQLANRLSINMEAPSDDGLASIAAEKKLTADILPRLTLAGKLSLKAKQDPGARLMAKAGVTSQFVVGASRDSDRDVLGMVGSLYKQKLLHHAHYAAFQPVVDTPFADRPAVPLLREFRLYQADYLFRLYGFRPDELVFDAVGNVPLEYDPKVAWALAHPENFPVEVTRAPIGVLMRVPGVGKIAAERIVTWRRSVHFRDETDLQKAGAVMKRARGFLTLNGRRFSDHLWAEQKNLWDFKAPAVDHALRTDDPPCAYR